MLLFSLLISLSPILPHIQDFESGTGKGEKVLILQHEQSYGSSVFAPVSLMLLKGIYHFYSMILWSLKKQGLLQDTIKTDSLSESCLFSCFFKGLDIYLSFWSTHKFNYSSKRLEILCGTYFKIFIETDNPTMGLMPPFHLLYVITDLNQTFAHPLATCSQ